MKHRNKKNIKFYYLTSFKTQVILNRNFSFNEVHVNGPRRLARIAHECGVEKFIHFSALNASPRPQKIFLKPSQFLISKVTFIHILIKIFFV